MPESAIGTQGSVTATLDSGAWRVKQERAPVAVTAPATESVFRCGKSRVLQPDCHYLVLETTGARFFQPRGTRTGYLDAFATQVGRLVWAPERPRSQSGLVLTVR